MYDELRIEELNRDDLLVDVRSESEYDDFHIPGAVSMPILNDAERKIVGTLYVDGNVNEAKSRAIGFASTKLSEFEKLVSGNLDRRIVFYCARGGYRSKSVSALFYSLGYDVKRLIGGIKAYRNHINLNLPKLLESFKLITLYGSTGSGKTKVLRLLKDELPVLDLEGFANHMGSVLGSIGMGEPNSQKMFEALLYEFLKEHPSSFYIAEGESKRIGNVVMSEPLWNKMVEAKRIYISSSMEARVKRLVGDYVSGNSTEEIMSGVVKLEKYLSKENYSHLTECIYNKKYAEAAELLCTVYYDHNYRFKPDDDTPIFQNENDEACAEEIKKYFLNYTKRN